MTPDTAPGITRAASQPVIIPAEDETNGEAMKNPTPTWPPREGDSVMVKDAGLVGTVIKTKGVHEARFRVLVPPPTEASSPVALKRERAAARLASRWYGLDELESPS
jgi:hypothetical protein